MAQTILITGASSGIGKVTAVYFADKGWNVAATMRKPEKVPDFKETRNLKKYALDVQNHESIKQAVNAVIKDFGKVNVLLNNAGYSGVGPLEFASDEKIRNQFEVNVFGLINTTKAVLPHFRENKSGRIINISSMGGRTTFPFFSLYHATKFAVEGISETLNYELNPLGIKIVLIEPGSVQTEFTGRSMDWFEGDIPEYNASIQNLKSLIETAHITKRQIPSVPEDVAKIIYKAATTNKPKLRYVVGNDAKMILMLRRVIGVRRTMEIVRRMYKL